MRIIARALGVALLVMLIAAGSVRASEHARLRNMGMDGCFDNAGRWYTREGVQCARG